MNINRNSWHYKWLRFWSIILPRATGLTAWNRAYQENMSSNSPQLSHSMYIPKQRSWEPDSLCVYVHLLWSRPLFIVLTLVPIFIAKVSIILVVNVIMSVAFFAWGVVTSIPTPHRKTREPKLARPPSVLKIYLKARHQKICPTLTYGKDAEDAT